ncbi:SHOCT domain-containing protein [Cellulomonas hominis]|jgi:type II secretory pathway pseudopilin PulG|uniref:Type II secretory pathway pseudopilin PulG n=1 Tax=Cellulomonas hominis TaxID=156981 RepID=A0A511FE59_9CELL|nr:SHOCT domain-containing protein [Cellulomonas hominis]MBB5475350.1 type II secretory pathway pseudopilin PulG [Cellulomonas hominis]MBU5423195.1 SHOCT domain-containing protein [Cellulomonas hominis]NKY12161.1 SHOCT domain-containing protein [Cellulomonas hominis]GEL46108.1 hypothetical protein CHO01_12240 [Cellulomonas hominis]
MPGLIRGVARTAVVAGTASAVAGRVQRRQQGRWAEQDAQQAQAQAYQQQQAQQAYAQQQQAYAQPAYGQSPYPQEPYTAPAPAQPTSPGVPAGSDMDARIAQLRDLAALRDQGVLSPEEFEAQKARILG